MQFLTDKVTKRLETHKSCTVFETELSRVWPRDEKKRQQRNTLIQEFAKAHGWSATILDPGIRVTFRKIDAGAIEKRDSDLAKAS